MKQKNIKNSSRQSIVLMPLVNPNAANKIATIYYRMVRYKKEFNPVALFNTRENTNRQIYPSMKINCMI
jgi:hypothetical protein